MQTNGVLKANHNQTQASNKYYVLLYELYTNTNVYLFLRTHKDSKLL